MAETQPPRTISDLDVEAAIHHATTNYAPLMHDRHRVKFSVDEGVVTLSGYVKAAPTYRYLLNHIDDVKGVKEVVVQDFYSDEEIRRDVGQAVPPGVLVTLEYGSVILSGNLPADAQAEDIVKRVALVPGVHRVLTSFVNG